jgi:hypothetical protein
MNIEKILMEINDSVTIQLFKYVIISDVCQNQYNTENSIIDMEKNKNQLRNNYNLIAMNIYPNLNLMKYFNMEFLIYYGWFPHVAKILLTENDYDFCNLMYFIFQENQKRNFQWDIFENEIKIKMNFNQYLIYLINTYNRFRIYFLSDQQFERNKCQYCSNRKVLQISDEYRLCQNYKIDFNQNNINDLCDNFVEPKNQE